jgi:hypothetical protein
MVIGIKKQRYGTGFVGDMGGWFHRKFRQFVSTQFQDSPMQYLTSDAYRDLGLNKHGNGL